MTTKEPTTTIGPTDPFDFDFWRVHFAAQILQQISKLDSLPTDFDTIAEAIKLGEQLARRLEVSRNQERRIFYDDTE